MAFFVKHVLMHVPSGPSNLFNTIIMQHHNTLRIERMSSTCAKTRMMLFMDCTC